MQEDRRLKEIVNKDTSKEKWEEAIKGAIMAGNYDVAFTDGSKLKDGKTGAGWTVRNQFHGGRGLGDTATVWDAEVMAITETLKRSKGKRMLILSDSKAAIAAVVKAGKREKGRTRELKEAADLIAKRCKKDLTAV